MSDLYKENKKEQWTTIITPQRGWFDLKLKDLLQYKDLILLFVRRDFVANYKQTVLGPLWFLIQPILTTIVFTIIFGRIAELSTDGVPQVLFYMSGVIMWNYFSISLTKISDTFVANAGIFGKVYFPRLAVPISTVLINMITFMIQFALLIALMIYYYINHQIGMPNLWIFAIPLLVLQMAALSMGVGIFISSMTAKYRDLAFLVSFGVQLWMYATPVVYPMSQIPDKWHWLFVLNPMTSVVSTFRYALLGAGEVDAIGLLVSAAVTFLMLLAGMVMFNRVERTFMDTV